MTKSVGYDESPDDEVSQLKLDNPLQDSLAMDSEWWCLFVVRRSAGNVKT